MKTIDKAKASTYIRAIVINSNSNPDKQLADLVCREVHRQIRGGLQ